MNKKILLLLVIACVISAIAFKVFAGPAGGSGCGIAGCNAVSTSTISLSQATMQVNFTNYMANVSTITITAFCGNSTGGGPCFNSSTSSYTQSNCSGTVACDSETYDYLVRNITGNFSNITSLQTITGSTYVASVGSDGIVRIIRVGDGTDTLWATFLTIASGELVSGIDVAESKLNDAVLEVAVQAYRPPATNKAVVYLGILDKATGVLVWDLGVYPTAITSLGVISYSVRITPAALGTDATLITVGHIDAVTTAPSTLFFGLDEVNNPLGPEEASGKNAVGFVQTGDTHTDGTTTTELGITSSRCITPGTVNNKLTVITGWADGIQDAARKSDKSVNDVGLYPNLNGDKFGLISGASLDTSVLLSIAQYAALNLINLNVYTPSSTFSPNAVKVITLNAGGIVVLGVDTSESTACMAFGNSQGTLSTTLYCVPNVPNAQLRSLGLEKGSAVGIISNVTDTIGMVARGSTLVSAFSVPGLNGWDVDVLATHGSEGHAGSAVEFLITGTDPTNNTIILDYFNTSMDASAINPNGTMRFTTDKYVSIQTMNPDINILNFRLGWQNFSGTFDTTTGICTGCSFDGSNNNWCQAEVEKIFGMFETYNLTINLTPDSNLTFTALNMLCRDMNQTVGVNSNCSSLVSSYYPASTYSSTGCMQWVNSTYATTFSDGLAIDLHNLTGSIEFNMGTLTPTPTCEMIACEINGTWEPGDTQEFTLNKTITVIAN